MHRPFLIASSLALAVGCNPNEAPTAPEIAITPEAPSTVDDLVLVIVTESVDADEDPVTYHITWDVDGTEAAIDVDTIPSDATAHGEVWTVTVTADDGELQSAPATAVVAIDNTPPVGGAVTLTPNPAVEGDTLTCTAAAGTDIDGDSVTYTLRWTIDGGDAGSTGTTLGSDQWGYDEEVRCYATPNDGFVDGPEVASNTVTIGNTAPTAPTVSLSGESTLEDLWCVVDAEGTDVDGQEVTYTVAWFVDGVEYKGATGTLQWPGDVLPADATRAGELWHCVMQSDDGVERGDVGTSPTVEVLGYSISYNILFSALINLNSSCSSVPDSAPYNGCSGDWGISWDDAGGSGAAAITVEMFQGIDCSGAADQDLRLNDVVAGALDFSGGNCDCDPSTALNTAVLTDTSGFVPAGTNTLMVAYGGSCEGLALNPDWGTDTYAVVTVDYE